MAEENLLDHIKRIISFSSPCAHLFSALGHSNTEKYSRKVIGSTLGRCQIHSFTVRYQREREVNDHFECMKLTMGDWGGDLKEWMKFEGKLVFRRNCREITVGIGVRDVNLEICGRWQEEIVQYHRQMAVTFKLCLAVFPNLSARKGFHTFY
jgi:hypothetical protein